MLLFHIIGFIVKTSLESRFFLTPWLLVFFKYHPTPTIQKNDTIKSFWNQPALLQMLPTAIQSYTDYLI